MKKNKLIGLLATLSCVATLAGVGVANISASAETTLDGVDVSSFQMDNGASARYKAADNYTGIRFTATLAEDKYLELENKEKNTEKDVTVDYGMLIVPYDLVKTNALTPESVFTGTATGEATDTKKYCVKNHETCNCGKTHIASVEYETLVDTKAGDNLYNLRGSLVEIQEHNLTREFVGVGYIKYTVDDVSQYAFANYYGGNIENNVRSTVYVAQIALETTGDDANGTLQEKYITPFVSGALKDEFKYTVNHYLPDEEGAYKEENKKTETLYGTLNSEVAATNIAKSTLENKLDYAEYATYGFSTEQGETSGTLYANGKTVLNCYYKEQSTTLWSWSDTDTSDMDGVIAVNGAKELPADFDATTNTEAGVYYDKNATYLGEKALRMTYHLGADGKNNTYDSGRFFLDLDPNKLAIAEGANWDYLTVRMAIVGENNVSQDNAVMYSWDMPLVGYKTGSRVGVGGLAMGTWVDLKISKATLADGSLRSAVRNKNENDQGMTKAAFDAAFRSVTVDHTRNADFLRICNISSDAGNDFTLTYYIQSISWGIDCEKPVLEDIDENDLVVYAADSVDYMPEVKATDDCVPNAQSWDKIVGGPIVSYAMYEMDGDNRNALTANDDGSFTLTKGKTYKLVVTADDRTVLNLPGNTATKEYTVRVYAPEQVAMFDFEGTKENVVTIAHDGVTPTIEWKDNYEGKTGVIKHATGASREYSGYFHLNLNDAAVNNILNAYFTDYATNGDNATQINENFKLIINMRVELSSTKTLAYLHDKDGGYSEYIQQIPVGEWTTVTIDASKLAWFNTSKNKMMGWSSVAEVKKRLTYIDANYYLFYLNGQTLKAGDTVTYYIDSIEYSTEANA